MEWTEKEVQRWAQVNFGEDLQWAETIKTLFGGEMPEPEILQKYLENNPGVFILLRRIVDKHYNLNYCTKYYSNKKKK